MTKTLKRYLLKFKFFILQCVQRKATIPKKREICAICSPKPLFLSCYKIGLIPKKMCFDYWKDLRNSDVSFWQSCNLMKLVLYHVIPFTMHGVRCLKGRFSKYFPGFKFRHVWRLIICTFECSLKIRDL